MPTSRATLLNALATCTEAEARAIYAALGQFVQNTEEYVENLGDEPDELGEALHLEPASAVLERMDAEFVKLAG